MLFYCAFMTSRAMSSVLIPFCGRQLSTKERWHATGHHSTKKDSSYPNEESTQAEAPQSKPHKAERRAITGQRRRKEAAEGEDAEGDLPPAPSQRPPSAVTGVAREKMLRYFSAAQINDIMMQCRDRSIECRARVAGNQHCTCHCAHPPQCTPQCIRFCASLQVPLTSGCDICCTRVRTLPAANIVHLCSPACCPGMLWTRLTDEEEAYNAWQSLGTTGMRLLRENVGTMVLFNPFAPNGPYELHLANRGHYMIAQCVVQLAVMEAVTMCSCFCVHSVWSL